MKKRTVIMPLLISLIMLIKVQAKEDTAKCGYSLRKYKNVKKFYSKLTDKTIEISIRNNIPPAAILSIAGLESGYGSGYISRITGNILSLGAKKGERKLSALFLPVHTPSKTIIFDTTEVKNYRQADVAWEQRPPSLKKDYRPTEIAGTSDNLTYFKNNPEQELEANLKCINDFVSYWISDDSLVPAYREAKLLMNNIVASKGKDALFSYETNKLFIEAIGGKPRSFNYRKSWGEKVGSIIRNTGLCPLTYEIYSKNSPFAKAWAAQSPTIMAQNRQNKQKI